jgi:formate dehydrogenase alpha subunit
MVKENIGLQVAQNSQSRTQRGITYQPTVCPYCTSGCGVYLVVENGEIIGQEPMKSYPTNEGKMCIKGNNTYKLLSHSQRLRRPLVNGKECSWGEALELIVEKFRSVSAEDFGIIGSGKTSNEEGYVLQKFARVVMNTNNIEYCARFCHSATVAGLGPAVGGGVMQTSQLHIDQADCIFLAGVNVQENFPGIARRIRRAKNNGTRVIVLDPRVTATVKNLADIHLQLNPGTDAALLNAMLKVIIEDGLENERFVETRTVNYRELKDFVSDIDLEEVQEITSVPLDKIKASASAFAKAAKGCILYDEGITQHITGSDNVKLLANLVLLTGHIGKPGTGVNSMRGQISGEGTGDMGCLNVFYPGFKRVNKETAEHFQQLWGVENLPSKPGKTFMDIINTCRIVYMVGVNPMISAPDSNNVRKSLEGLDFLVVQDIFMTETAEIADVVLPAATWVEREGTHTGIDRRVYKINEIVEPPGQAKPDWWITMNIANRMGFSDKFDYNSSKDIFEEIRACVPQYAGISYERLENTTGGIHWPCPTEGHPGTPTMFTEKFNTPDGKGHFQLVEYKPPAESTDQEYPFILTTGRVIFHYHTGSMTRRTDNLYSEVPEAFMQIHPEDAHELKISDGEKAIVKSRRGQLEIKTSISPDITRGVVFIPFHFNRENANILTNPAFDPACKMPEFKVCAVNIEKVDEKKVVYNENR